MEADAARPARRADLGLCLGIPPIPLPDYAAVAAAAETAGVAVLAAGEARYDSMAVAASLAAATSAVPLMTSVATWSRSPVSAAVAAMTLAEISQNRFTLGLGTMPPAWNRDFHGIDPRRPLARLREYLAVVRAAGAAWAGQVADYEGEFFTVRGYGAERAEPPQHAVPIHLAATRPAMARLAAEIGDGVIINVVHTVDWVRSTLVPAMDEGEMRSGRTTPRAVMVRVVLHDGSRRGRESALATAGSALARYRPVPYFREIATAEGLDPDRLDDERLITRFVTLGTVEEVAHRLQDYVGLCDLVLLTPAASLPMDQLQCTYRALTTLVGQSRNDSGTR